MSVAAERRKSGGASFDDADVARCYAHRPPYAPGVFSALLERASGRRRALDLGTGNGKIAGALASCFASIDAVEPSPAMLNEARRLWPATNINWIQARGEVAPLEGPYDVVTAGAAIHWMESTVIFPRLAALLAPSAPLALIDGDGVSDAPWKPRFDDFIRGWIERLGDTYDSDAFRELMTAHHEWIDVSERLSFSHQITQRIEDLIECQHARATFARHAIGAENADRFDAELSALLAPFAKDGMLRYEVTSNLVLGRPRTTPITP